MPKQLGSPTWVQKFRKGNCFECATFLASLLLGQGYNAFVISGYASREQTLCDLTRKSCPCVPRPDKQAEREPKAEQPEITKYKFKLMTEYNSQFLLKLEEEEARKLEEKLLSDEKEQQKLIEELEQLPPDEYWGHRIHGWVAILPELDGPRDQEIPCPLFIEPTTGVSYGAADDDTAQLYLGVESIWNDKNYWVNMQSSAGSCANIAWDLTKVELWEHLLPGESWTMHEAEEVDEESGVEHEKHLDMPASYVDQINISEAEFEKRFPNGTKTTFYKRTKVERYAPYLQPNGLVQKITIYDDYDYTSPIEVYENYANRSDNLVKSRKDLNNDTVVDYYARGRADQCKEHRYFVSAPHLSVDSERILDFYHVARFDGLSKFEMHPNYLTQHFVDRDDFLYYRHVQFSRERKSSAPHDIHYRHISNIVEKFNRDERIKASKNIAIREFAIDENEIRLTYHYHPGQFTRVLRTYIKPPLAERGERLVLNVSTMQGYTPLEESEKSLHLLYELETQLKEEDVSVSQVRAAEKEMYAFLETRNKEYLLPTLSISIYDKLREPEFLTEALMKTNGQEDITEDVDYLKPYLARLGNPSELSNIDAYFVQYTCLNDYKQLLVQRANKILREFDRYSQELIKTQALLTQDGDVTREEEENLLEKINEINFHLQMLETRLNRHRDLVPIRYEMLMDHLQQSPHLAILRDDSK
ncbi:dynein regulatory complex subunit 7 [Frieseomelitta varia]|uniref:dynein regulatory complex subunit 7 n=1 Tax=Frieseomelitta varia TaxID=561572 RepID=UPI001CB69ECB|nr:dynein regulatory complex subunit 7 [Frieseomelitta varia]